jgi:hypothetical protein
LKDLDWGSWEAFTPARLKSRRGCHSSPRRLSFSLYVETARCALLPDTLSNLLHYS